MIKKLSRFFTGGLCALLFLTFPAIKAEAAAASGIVMEAGSGRVLYESAADERLPMASTTKIMTCILALENADPGELITVEAAAAGIEGSSMYLRAGETLTMEELIYGLMIASGNDAACAIAIHIAGTVEAFCEMMNEKAAALGAVNTHFTSPNGLHGEDHYTTARDLASIACYAMQNESFRTIVSTTSMDIPADSDSPARYLRSKNKILYQLEGGNGIKTGYTKAAGKCLVAGAQRGGMQLVSVVLNDYDMFADSMYMLESAFASYSLQNVLFAGENIGTIAVNRGIGDSLECVCAEDISLPLAENEVNMVERKITLPENVSAPVKKGESIGTVEVYLNGALMGSSDIIAAADVGEDTFLYHLMRVLDGFWGGKRENENSEIFGLGGSGVQAQG